MLKRQKAVVFEKMAAKDEKVVFIPMTPWQTTLWECLRSHDVRTQRGAGRGGRGSVSFLVFLSLRVSILSPLLGVFVLLFRFSVAPRAFGAALRGRHLVFGVFVFPRSAELAIGFALWEH